MKSYEQCFTVNGESILTDEESALATPAQTEGEEDAKAVPNAMFYPYSWDVNCCFKMPGK